MIIIRERPSKKESRSWKYCMRLGMCYRWIDALNQKQVTWFFSSKHWTIWWLKSWIVINPFFEVALWWHTPGFTHDWFMPLFVQNAGTTGRNFRCRMVWIYNCQAYIMTKREKPKAGQNWSIYKMNVRQCWSQKGISHGWLAIQRNYIINSTIVNIWMFAYN